MYVYIVQIIQMINNALAIKLKMNFILIFKKQIGLTF